MVERKKQTGFENIDELTFGDVLRATDDELKVVISPQEDVAYVLPIGKKGVGETVPTFLEPDDIQEKVSHWSLYRVVQEATQSLPPHEKSNMTSFLTDKYQAAAQQKAA